MSLQPDCWSGCLLITEVGAASELKVTVDIETEQGPDLIHS